MKTFKELVHMAHDKSGDEELLEMMQWWYDATDAKMKREVCEQLKKLAYRIPLDEAEQIVRAMRPRGQYWSYNQVKDFLATKKITTGCVDYYLVMNMAYNDFYYTAQNFGLQNEVEFYYSLAKDFIEDPDASPYKVERYFSEA